MSNKYAIKTSSHAKTISGSKLIGERETEFEIVLKTGDISMDVA